MLFLCSSANRTCNTRTSASFGYMGRTTIADDMLLLLVLCSCSWWHASSNSSHNNTNKNYAFYVTEPSCFMRAKLNSGMVFDTHATVRPNSRVVRWHRLLNNAINWIPYGNRAGDLLKRFPVSSSWHTHFRCSGVPRTWREISFNYNDFGGRGVGICHGYTVFSIDVCRVSDAPINPICAR